MKDYMRLKEHIRAKESVSKNDLNSILSHILIHRSPFGEMFTLRDFFKMMMFLKYCPCCKSNEDKKKAEVFKKATK